MIITISRFVKDAVIGSAFAGSAPLPAVLAFRRSRDIASDGLGFSCETARWHPLEAFVL